METVGKWKLIVATQGMEKHFTFTLLILIYRLLNNIMVKNTYVIVFLSVDLFSGLALFKTFRKSEVFARILL